MKTPKPVRKLFKRMNKLIRHSPAFRQYVENVVAQHAIYYTYVSSLGKAPEKPDALVIETGGIISPEQHPSESGEFVVSRGFADTLAAKLKDADAGKSYTFTFRDN